MRILLLLGFITLLAGEALAQRSGSGQAEPVLAILDAASAFGQPAHIFNDEFGHHTMSAFHTGSTFDVTYWIVGEGMLTIEFNEGEAELFRLITRRGRDSAEELPRMLGIDTRRLKLIEEMDVKKVWRGWLSGRALAVVAAISGPEGWTQAEAKVEYYAYR